MHDCSRLRAVLLWAKQAMEILLDLVRSPSNCRLLPWPIFRCQTGVVGSIGFASAVTALAEFLDLLSLLPPVKPLGLLG